MENAKLIIILKKKNKMRNIFKKSFQVDKIMNKQIHHCRRESKKVSIIINIFSNAQ